MIVISSSSAQINRTLLHPSRLRLVRAGRLTVAGENEFQAEFGEAANPWADLRGRQNHFPSAVNRSVTFMAHGDQVLFRIISTPAPELTVVDLQICS